jgi:predicted permease
MTALLQSLRHAARQLRRAPSFTLIAILTLALGIGANTAIFSVVYTAFLRPLPFDDGERLVRVYEAARGQLSTLSPSNFADFATQSRLVRDLSAYYSDELALTGVGVPERVQVGRVTADAFDALRVQPALGRLFTDDESRVGGPKAVLLAHALWTRRFGGARDIVGQQVRLDGVSYQVIGVMPEGFTFPRESQLWMPLAFTSEELATQRGAHYLSAVGRLRDGATLAAADLELRAIAQRLERAYPAQNTDVSARVLTFRDAAVGDSRRALFVLLGAVGFLLLVACANVANLLLARAGKRSQEFAVRIALGAGRGRLALDIMTEGVLLAILGGVVGVLLAVWGLPLITAAIGSSYPALARAQLDWPVLLYTLAIALATATLFAAGPALVASRPTLVAAALRGVVSGAGRRTAGWRLRGTLVAAETALAVTLLAGAGLLLKSFSKLSSVEPGFDPRGVWTLELSLPDAEYPPERSRQFYSQLLERTRALPGVHAAGGSTLLPLQGGSYRLTYHTVDGVPEPTGRERVTDVRIVTDDYFRATGMRIVRGRPLLPTDRDGAPRAVVVNEALAHALWPGQDPIGHRLEVGSRFGLEGERGGGEVVGVVADVRELDLATPPRPGVFLAHRQFPVNGMSLVVRADDPPSIRRPLLEQIAALDPNLPVANERTLDALARESITEPRLYATLLSAFAITALVMAAVGIYGVMAVVIGQRTREIGIRMALGARAADVVRLVVGQGTGLAAIGALAGLAVAFPLTRLMRDLLYDVAPADPLVFTGVAVVLVLTALLAAWLPARRAAKVDPMTALRAE